MKLQELRKLVREEVENMLGSKYNLSLRYPGGIYRTDKDSQELAKQLYKVANFTSNKRPNISVANFRSLVNKITSPSDMFRNWMIDNVDQLGDNEFIELSSSSMGDNYVVTIRTSKDIESARNVATGLDKLGNSGLD